MKTIFWALPLVLLSTSCSRFFYQPAARQPDEVQVIYTHGVPAIRAEVAGSDVSVDLTSRGKTDMNLGIFIRNTSDSVYTFDPEDVKVYGFDNAGRRTPYKVFSAEQFIRRQHTKAAIAAGVVLAAVIATAVATADSDNDSDGEWFDNDCDNDWWWWAWVATPTIVVNANPPAPPFIADDHLLRRHTIYPGEALQGIIKVRSEYGFRDKILVEFPVNGDYTKFVFDRAKRRF